MPSYNFNMALPAERTERIYQGRATSILVETDDGLKLQLPAANFREYVRSNGIHGRFSVSVDANNKIISLRKL